MQFAQHPGYKIAILNCYLQGGHTQTAEIEAAKRLEIAAKNIGADAKMFAKSEELYDYAPDIVLCHAYQDAKLTHFPTYGTLTMPPAWVRNQPRFVRNILSYDAYISLSDSVNTYVAELSAKTGKPIPSVFSAFSVPYAPFTCPDFSNAYAAYLGTNWDGARHGSFFELFDNKDVLKCFGPKKSWTYLPKDVYGHPVPFDGKSVGEVYRKSGIGLCFNHKDFEIEGIPTSRFFEIPSGSAIVLGGNNPLLRSLYGDAALYVDTNLSHHELAQQVTEKVHWVRSNPKKAAEMAEQTHTIFSEKLCMEVLLDNLINFHTRTFKDPVHFISPSAKTTKAQRAHSTDSVVHSRTESILAVCWVQKDMKWKERIIDSLLQQRVKPSRILVLHSAPGKRAILGTQRATIDTSRSCIIEEVYTDIPLQDDEKNDLYLALNHVYQYHNISEKRVVCFMEGDLPFSTHLEYGLSLCQPYTDANGDIFPEEAVIAYTGAVEYSEKNYIHELIKDSVGVPRKEKLRLGQFSYGVSAPTHLPKLIPSSLFIPKLLIEDSMQECFDLGMFMRFLGRKGKFLFSPHVTLHSKSTPEHHTPFFKLD